MTLFLLAADPAAASAWLPFVERVGIPVAMAGALLWWALTRLEKRLEEFPTAMRENTKATVEFTAEIRALREQLGEVARDVDALRENTGQHRLQAGQRGG